MIKKVNYKRKECFYVDLKVGDTFRYIDDEDDEIIFMSKAGPIRLSTGDIIHDFNDYDNVIRFDITIDII